MAVLNDFDALYARLDDCMLADRHALRKRIHRMRSQARQGQDIGRAYVELERRIQASMALAQARRARLPQVHFPADLPVSQKADAIQQCLQAHQVVIVCGETGSGKSTQLPKMCLAMARGIFGRIAHTQPRRIAARSLASRIAFELGSELGEHVGYKVRFHDRVGPYTHVKLLTDGMLLAEIQNDRFLEEYDTIIIDEAHERSLNIDFLLGYLKQLLPKRPELKLIITSATIDPEKFSRHFDDAPIIEVSGRSHPVEVRYRPPSEEDEGSEDPRMQALLDAIDELSREDRGDILVFLSGEREIREAAKQLSRHRLQATEILPLYARLSPAEQARIFQPARERRIVLATNVAETSLTVPGIRHVIDLGDARISRYSHKSKIQRLPIEPISQASANQRKGRCGRVAPGICIRLYSEEDYLQRPEFTEPEIQRTNLAAVILQMKLLGFSDIHHFPFVDSPDPRQIKDGFRILHELGAVDTRNAITLLGRKLARLPVDPRVGRMLLEAAHTHCLREVLVIAALLSIQDPRERPLDKREQADQAHALFRHEESDFLSLWSLWQFLEEKRRHLSRRKFRRLCEEYFISYTRVREWRDIYIQLRTLMHEMGYRDNQEDAGYESIHRALLSGLLSHVGFRDGRKEKGYLGSRNRRFHLFPGSALFTEAPKWVMAAELVETSKLYARINARIEPQWVESLAAHLVKRSYSEPHWQSHRGQVGAYERVTLFGLTLVARRRVNYGPIDPQEARAIFIRRALVEGDFHTRAPFWRHNQALLAEVRDLEARTRRPDLLVDEEKIWAFYDSRIPEGIYSKPLFEKWLRMATREQPKLLHMRMEDVLAQTFDAQHLAQFPKTLDLDGLVLPLEYRFEPGHEADGVTVVVPAALLNQLPEARLDYLVPGLLEEKIVTLMKSLPKSLRKQFVPVPDYARRAQQRIQPSDMPLIQALGAVLKALNAVHIPEDAWNLEALPDYLHMRIRVIDAQGKTLMAGRDIHKLRRACPVNDDCRQPSAPVHELEGRMVRKGDFPHLPERLHARIAGMEVSAWPALYAEADQVVVRLFASREQAEQAHALGLRRLIQLSLPHDMRQIRKQVQRLDAAVRLQYAKAPRPEHGDTIALEHSLLALIVDRAFALEERNQVRDADAFERLLEAGRSRLWTEGEQVLQRAQAILQRYQRVRKALAGITQINWLPAAQDMRRQLDRLVFQGFFACVPWSHLQHYPRYLDALLKRIEKLPLAPARDKQRMDAIQELERPWLERWQRLQNHNQHDSRLEEIRWMLEEFRVSLFAQELKTAYPVSAKRIKKRWQALGL